MVSEFSKYGSSSDTINFSSKKIEIDEVFVVIRHRSVVVKHGLCNHVATICPRNIPCPVAGRIGRGSGSFVLSVALAERGRCADFKFFFVTGYGSGLSSGPDFDSTESGNQSGRACQLSRGAKKRGVANICRNRRLAGLARARGRNGARSYCEISAEWLGQFRRTGLFREGLCHTQ